MKRTFFYTIVLILTTAFLGLYTHAVFAADVNLAWDANEQEPDGYWVFVRDPGTPYDYNDETYKQAGPGTTITIPDLVIGQTYAFVVRAYVGDQASGDSNEIILEIPAPPVTITVPTNVGGLTVTIQYTPTELGQ